MTQRFIDVVCRRLRDNQRVRRNLPVWGRIHIDRQLPFLCVYRRPVKGDDAGTERLATSEASYLIGSGQKRLQPGLADLLRGVAATLVEQFGACLMLEPGRVADCVAAMRAVVSVPVTVKCRIGVDERDSDADLDTFIERLLDAGLEQVIIHARKAWLSGLSPKQNREIPPLDYPRVHRLKREFPALPIAINGGFTTEEAILQQVGKVDGVMLGRIAVQDPMLIGRLDRALGEDGNRRSETTAAQDSELARILAAYAVYIRSERQRGTPVRAMTRHLLGFIKDRPGARRWRRRLSELADSETVVDELAAELTSKLAGTLYNARLA